MESGLNSTWTPEYVLCWIYQQYESLIYTSYLWYILQGCVVISNDIPLHKWIRTEYVGLQTNALNWNKFYNIYLNME
jgi:hypothetical protein